MRAETMRKTVTVLSVVWILWHYGVSKSTDTDKYVGGAWNPVQGFETRKSCISAAEKNSSGHRTLFDMPMHKTEKEAWVFHCFPSGFSPRR